MGQMAKCDSMLLNRHKHAALAIKEPMMAENEAGVDTSGSEPAIRPDANTRPNATTRLDLATRPEVADAATRPNAATRLDLATRPEVADAATRPNVEAPNEPKHCDRQRKEGERVAEILSTCIKSMQEARDSAANLNELDSGCDALEHANKLSKMALTQFKQLTRMGNAVT